MSGRLSDYLYDLPAGLIASRPTPRREDSRMLVLHRKSGAVEHRCFVDLSEYLIPDDLLVLNDSKVIPARLHDSTGKVELLLMEKRDERHWIAMVNPGKKMRVGHQVEAAGTTATVLEILDDGTRLIEFGSPPDLDLHGEMPIPPYFQRASDEEDKIRYQTVYAREEGSVAAPTAGLHFTPEILARHAHSFVTLHVGAGTFRPVKTEDITHHAMHREFYTLPASTVERINQTRNAGGKIIAVGTTTARVLESQPAGELRENRGSTDIFIYPHYAFQRIDALLTNFHLPGSTLLMLVSAFAERELILATYAEAVRKEYRFFSYGDCMLIM
ncbi:MAG: tRNA preQ1(34) S-adenosylmethionine ribosyltransferase-isomerase QueA [bacterium]